MRIILISVLALSLAATAVTGCGGEGDSAAGDVAIAASTTQLGDFARQVGGDRADVTQILAANSDPHEYEPKPSDVEAVADADLILQSGGDLDLWLNQIIDSSGSSAPVLTLIDSVDTREQDGELDPHWWQDPENAIRAVEAIRDELIEVDPDGEKTYTGNAADYIAKLKTLDRQIASCIDEVPADERKLVTSHDALGYYADRYGIDVIGAVIPALTSQAQASGGETQDLIDLIKRTGVKTIYAEAGVNQQLEQAIADEAGATVGGQLWADTLGPEGSDGATYIEAEEANTEKLVAGFTGGAQVCQFQVDGP